MENHKKVYLKDIKFCGTFIFAAPIFAALIFAPVFLGIKFSGCSIFAVLIFADLYLGNFITGLDNSTLFTNSSHGTYLLGHMQPI